MAIERTLSIVKPDGVQNGHIGHVIAIFEGAGLKIAEATQQDGWSCVVAQL